MTDYTELSQSLTRSLRLSRSPVAVCLYGAEPVGIPAFEGTVAAGCRFWEEAEQGPVLTSVPDHERCPIGTFTHNMPSEAEGHPADREAALAALAQLDYVRPEELAAMPVLEQETRYAVYAPLDRTPRDPDVVLLFGDSRQGLVFTEAAARVEGGAPPALGRPACAIVPQAVGSGRAAVSLGCCGARAYLDALTDDVALWAIPGAKVAQYAAELEILARANDVLTRFHGLRRRDVEAGKSPTVQETLEELQRAG